MIDNAFRALLPRFVSPLIALYGRLGWTPNHVSVLGFALAGLAALAVAQGFWGLALGLWWVSRLADGTDGIYARASGQESDFGAYFDMLLDIPLTPQKADRPAARRRPGRALQPTGRSCLIAGATYPK